MRLGKAFWSVRRNLVPFLSWASAIPPRSQDEDFCIPPDTLHDEVETDVCGVLWWEGRAITSLLGVDTFCTEVYQKIHGRERV